MSRGELAKYLATDKKTVLDQWAGIKLKPCLLMGLSGHRLLSRKLGRGKRAKEFIARTESSSGASATFEANHGLKPVRAPNRATGAEIVSPPSDPPQPLDLAPESTALARVTGGALASLSKQAAEHAKHAKSDRTLEEYEKQWVTFCDWCRLHRVNPLPADAGTLAAYVTARAETVGVSSLGQALSAISYFHNKARLPSARHDPAFKDVFEGIVRKKGRAKNKKDALTLVKLSRILPVLSGETAVRDRALLLVGYAAGLRRIEIVQTEVSHFKRDELGRGYVLNVPRSKTDQRGEGMLKAIPVNRRDRLMCPASAFEDWLSVSGINEGRLFRPIQNCELSPGRFWGEDVARIVKRWAKRAGIENWENLSGHSMRSGFITDARRNKSTWAQITKQTGQTEKTAEGYVRGEEIWEDNAAVELFR